MATQPAHRRRRRLRMVVGALTLLLVVLAAALGVVRYGLVSDQGRAMVMRLANGRELGPFGRLHLEGLRGDLLHDFTIRRLTVVDQKGVWIEGRNIAVRWQAGELLSRRFHAERIAAESVTVLRAPAVEPRPPQKAKPLPVAILLDQVRFRLETRPALSVRAGLWDIDGRADITRDGAAQGRLDAQSRLHAGDGVAAVFGFGGGRPTQLKADVVEARGGALAGVLGLPADRRLFAKAVATGDATGAARLSLDTLSGDLHPLRAQGSWSKAGATLSATALLAASKLTSAYADKLGPELALTATARQDRGDLYNLDVTAKTREAHIHAMGPFDARRQSTPGLKLELAVAALSRLLPQADVGPVKASGTLTGDLSRFRYAADIQAENLSQSGYSLARVSGPATLIRDVRTWTVQAQLAGAGGTGKGLVFALLGAAPKVKLDGLRLPDGRLMGRELRVAGAGLRLDATGGQGLLGGLSFKGSATLSNLAVAHKGAHGQLDGSWTAAQAKAAKAWDVTFDAYASKFASGIAEVDRLVGAAPRLTAKGAYGPLGLQVARADLAGANLQAGVKGTLSAAQALAFTVDWRAKGPFAAGPVEIAGEAKGSGAITGKLAAPRADLKADIASIDFGRLVLAPAHLDLGLASGPDGLDGTAALSGSSRYGPASARTAFAFAGNGIELHDLSADAAGVKAAGSLALRNGAPSTADLTVSVGPGAFLTAGKLGGAVKLTGGPTAPTATLRLDGQGVAAPELHGTLKSVRLTASGPLSRLPFQVAVESVDPVVYAVNGSGVFARTGEVNQIDLNASGRVRTVAFRTTEAAVIRIAPKDNAVRLRLQVAGGTAAVDARQAADALTAHATVASVGLAALQQDFVGKINADLALNGRGAQLGGTLDATLAGARSRDAPESLALAGRVHGVLAGQRLRVEASASNPQGLRSRASVDLPAEAAAQPFRVAIDRTKPMRGDFSADGELRPLWDLLVGGDQAVSGKLAASGSIGGTLNKPQASGRASLTGGKLTDSVTGLNLQGLMVQAAFDQGAVDVRQFSGADGRGGTVSGDGRVSLTAGGGSTFALKLDRFQLIDNDTGRASASGAVTVTRDTKGLAKLAGVLTIDRAEISPSAPVPTGVVAMDVVEIHRKGGDQPSAKPKTSAGPSIIALDVAIRAPRGVYIRGKGLDLELALDAHVGGSTTRPDLTGTARVVRGAYDFAGKRFDFDSSGEVRLATTAEAIRLNLTATREDPTLTAVVRVTGTAARPEVALTSTPVLPQDEILSQVLFGQSAAQLSPGQAAQLASALASLSGGKGLDLIGGLRQFARLDRLSIGGDQATGTTVSGGKYLTDKVYVELTGGGRLGPSASVEYRVRRNLAIVSSYASQSETRAGQADTRLSVRFRKDFR